MNWVDEEVQRIRAAVGASSAPSPGAAPVPIAIGQAAALAPFIDHTLLRPEATPDDALRWAAEAKEHGFAGVCVNAWHVGRVARALEDAGVRPVAVVGFPLGATFSTVKAEEARRAVEEGAQELDMVVNLGALRAGLLEEALEDLRAVVKAAGRVPVKVILETHLLTPEQQVAGCALAELAGAAFVKTSTGFTGGGAQVEDVLRMRRAVGDRLAVKASGGIRSVESARALLEAGARRLGSSSGVMLVAGGSATSSY